jgi:hypothetical protein
LSALVSDALRAYLDGPEPHRHDHSREES